MLLSTVVLAMGGTLLAGPALAQVFYRPGPFLPPNVVPFPGPGLYAYAPPVAPMPPSDVSDILLDDFRFRQVGRPRFTGRAYVVDGVDRAGASVRVYMDAFSGRLVDVDILSPAPARPGLRERQARLSPDADAPRPVPSPPRRPAESALPGAKPPSSGAVVSPDQPRSAARPPETPALRAAPPAPPAVPTDRDVRRVDPAETRVPDEVDKPPPLTRGLPTLVPVPDAPKPTASEPVPATAAAPVPEVRASAPGASIMAPAPLDDPQRVPSGPAAAPVPTVPLL